ncbi:MAG: hypothetical protein RSC06_16060 [Clostridia bacterium]
MNFDKGLAIGIDTYAKVAANSAGGVGKGVIGAARNALANLSTLISEDMNADPVIRPVVDLSNVSSGVRTIRSMLSGSSTIGVDGERTRKLAGSISAERAENRKAQTTSKSIRYDNSNSGNVTLQVENLNTQNKEDISVLALELSKYNGRLQFGWGG